jgi:hypothetical protein
MEKIWNLYLRIKVSGYRRMNPEIFEPFQRGSNTRD